MPALPFTLEDLKNAKPFDAERASAESKTDPAVANPRAAQNFLVGKMNQLRDSLNSTDGLIDLGMSINPGLRYVDMASRFFGGPSVSEGFKDGVTQPAGDERSGQTEIVLPPMPF